MQAQGLREGVLPPSRGVEKINVDRCIIYVASKLKVIFDFDFFIIFRFWAVR